MNRYWIVVAIILMAIGLTVFATVMTVNNWDFSILETDKMETSTHIIDSEFNNISVNTNTTDVTVLKSEDGVCKVVCTEYSKQKHTALVEDQTLTVSLSDQRKWYEHIQIFSRPSSVKVYLPDLEYGALIINGDTSDVDVGDRLRFDNIDVSLTTGDVRCNASSDGAVKIKVTTGDIDVEKICAGTVDVITSTGRVKAADVECAGEFSVSVSTGKVLVEKVSCKSFNSEGSTGDLDAEGLIAEDLIFVKRNTGDVELENCDAAEITVKTTTGDVEGVLLSDKIFVVRTDTGKIEVPQTTSGGVCNITTDTGDIEFKVK